MLPRTKRLQEGPGEGLVPLAVPRWPMAVATELCPVLLRFFISHVCGSCLGSSLEPGLLSPCSERINRGRNGWLGWFHPRAGGWSAGGGQLGIQLVPTLLCQSPGCQPVHPLVFSTTSQPQGGSGKTSCALALLFLQLLDPGQSKLAIVPAGEQMPKAG